VTYTRAYIHTYIHTYTQSCLFVCLSVCLSISSLWNLYRPVSQSVSQFNSIQSTDRSNGLSCLSVIQLQNSLWNERERTRTNENERERASERASVCVCVCVWRFLPGRIVSYRTSSCVDCSLLAGCTDSCHLGRKEGQEKKKREKHGAPFTVQAGARPRKETG